MAEVVGEPGLAQLTVANQQVFSAARQRAAFSWNELAGSAKVVGWKLPGSASAKWG